MRQEERDTYIIPPNFIEGGTLMGGMFKTRNVIEAGILGAATGVPVLKLPFSLTTRIIILCLTTLPLVLVALIGIGGGSLSEFILQFFSFLHNRRTLDRDGANRGKKSMLPSWGHSTPREEDGETPKSRNRLEVDLKGRKVDRIKTFLAPEVKPLNPLADYVPVENIKHGVIYTRDHRHVKILEVVPVNFLLRSAQEQRSIIYSFISYLKIAPVKVQFKVLTKRADIDRHVQAVRRELERETDPHCRMLQEDYLRLIRQLGSREAITRRFFLIFEHEPLPGTKRGHEEEDAIASLQTAARTAANYLRQCGNTVVLDYDDESEAAAEVLYHILCRQESNERPFEEKAKQVVAEYMTAGRPVDQIPVNEFYAPNHIDLSHGRHICIDGVYYAYLLVPSGGYKAQVPAGWLSLLVNAGDGIDLDMFLTRQPKDRMIRKLGQQLRINRSKIKETSDTNTDFDDLDGAIRSGYFLKDGLSNNEDFYYLNLLVTITANIQQSDIYAEYIATRPRVERLGGHGLFGDEDYVDLKKVTVELERCERNVWTHIVSLKRKDAARLGYDNARSWRNLLRAHRNDIAAAMNIPPNDFRWYAAFHDEGDHPHVHMMAWSAGDAPGYLSPVGIRDIKSVLTTDIFRQEMLHVYEQKSQSRDELVAETRRTMLELADQMKHGICEHPEAEQMLLTLARELKSVKGKKQYGYLPTRVKKQVDEIVDQMVRLPSVQTCYEKWLELQQEANEFYSDKPMERIPLSQQKEFRAIHNAVVQAAVQLGQLTFEDKDIEKSDEPDNAFQTSDVYWNLWTVICDEREPLNLRDKGVAHLRSKAEGGNPYAQLLLGRLYRNGPLLTPDWVEARYWFEQAAQHLPDAQYALGKLLLTDDVEVHDREQGLRWLTRAAEHGNEYAAYRLGKELLRSGDTADALSWLTVSAETDNPYAMYLLGKLYWEGEVVPQDREQAVYWLTQAAAQGHTHAQILLERQDSSSLPSAILAVNNLLHQMGRVFQDNAWPQDGTRGQHTERKLRRKMQQKRIAMGHKPDDHEEQGWGSMTTG